MNFFEHQEQARKQSRTLVLLYAAAVLCIILSVYFAVIIAFGATARTAHNSSHSLPLWEPRLFFMCTAGTLLLVVLGSLWKTAQLASGGSSVAELLGGTRVDPGSATPAERRLLNVVEEMALASGVAVPPVYVLTNEPGINAFAAGYSPNDAVVAVTSGALEEFSRDELQGVIAHEFSHILNGDMRLNIRLMGTLHGILVLALTGYWLVRIMGQSRSSSSSRRSSKGDLGPAILLFGALLMAVGYIGVFFGRLMKSAVSRQREFLADASAVQFTRNPSGIGGALARIAQGEQPRSRLETPRAEEASHMFFADALRRGVAGLMATHPPIDERIRRLDPRLAEGILGSVVHSESSETPGAAGFAPQTSTLQGTPQAIVQSVGSVSAAQIDFAANLLQTLPQPLSAAAHDPSGAFALLLAIVATDTFESDSRIQGSLPPAVRSDFSVLFPLVRQLPREALIPLVDLATPTLRLIAKEQYYALVQAMTTIVNLDASLTLFEYSVLKIVERRVGAAFGGRKHTDSTKTDRKALTRAIQLILSAFAHTSASADKVFRAGRNAAEDLRSIELLPPAACSFAEVSKAIEVLSAAPPLEKEKAMLAFSTCIAADGVFNRTEGELLRAVAESIDVPLPPFG